MIQALAAFGLGYLFFKFAQENGGDSQTSDENSTEDGNITPSVPFDTGKESTVLTSVYSSGGDVLFKLELLQGQAYENPETQKVTDETYYQEVGYVVGDVSQTAFVTQNDSTGAIMFSLNGTSYSNVRIYTEDSGKAYIDEKNEPSTPDDPVSKPQEEAPLPPTNDATPSLPTFGAGSRFSTFGGF